MQSERMIMIVGLLLLVAVDPSTTTACPQGKNISLEKKEGQVVIKVGDDLFAKYDFRGYARPIFFPVFGPGQVPMTRAYPMQTVDGEASDHPHHKSVWFAHGAVNGIDFWKEDGSIAHVSFDQFDPQRGFTVTDHWLDPASKKPLLVVTGKFQFGVDDSARWIDCEYVLRAADQEVLLGDTKEGTFAIRTHPDLRLVANPKQGVKEVFGKARNSAGDTGKPIWGKSAKWVDYAGKVNGQPVGIAMLDHPSNLRHPTTWHAREYGLVAANPFGYHYFKKQPKGAGDYRLKPGDSLTLRYRVVFYAGERSTDEVEAYFQEFAN